MQTESTFEELVQEAIDGLAPELIDLLERQNIAIVISDDGAAMKAYGVYRGDGAVHDNVPDQILIFRDTLTRDFGHDPIRLRAEVVQTIKHELAHHLGYDEKGVRRLGL